MLIWTLPAFAQYREPGSWLPDETAGLEKIVQALISAFDHADVVALGESHWNKLDSDLRIALVRDPEFPKKADFIVVEFASTSEQSILDRYIRGVDVPIVELQRVWRNTTQNFGVWESPVYAKFFAAVRDVNQRLRQLSASGCWREIPPQEARETATVRPYLYWKNRCSKNAARRW